MFSPQIRIVPSTSYHCHSFLLPTFTPSMLCLLQDITAEKYFPSQLLICIKPHEVIQDGELWDYVNVLVFIKNLTQSHLT